MNQVGDLKKEIEELKNRVKKLEERYAFDNSPDELFKTAVNLIQQHDFVSASFLQRRLSIGYSRATRILDQLEEKGLIERGEGGKPRKVIKK